MLERTIGGRLREGLGKPGTALVLYGPRQAGKTTLVRMLLGETPKVVSFVGDDLYAQSLLARHDREHRTDPQAAR